MADQSINKKQVWLISGCSTGFGREIALAALESGAQVVVTARRAESVADICQRFPEQSLALALDVTDGQQIEAVVATVIAHFGTIDVLVNNAGYGYVGAIEEGDDDAVRTLFDTNFFGGLQVLRQLPRPSCRQRIAARRSRLVANPAPVVWRGLRQRPRHQRFPWAIA